MDVPPLPTGVVAEANHRLDAIEREDHVGVLAAVESGSRAWGFPSPDSDYDVRFIYLRPVSAYVRLYPGRDVIERPLDGLWDINGWDLRKALLLLCRGNAVVIEWLRSPHVYRQVGDVPARMRQIAAEFGDADHSVRHYFGLLRGGWTREFEGRGEVRLKKYFYVIRAAAALAWLRSRDSLPPMALPELVAGGVFPNAVDAEVEGLLQAKTQASEIGVGARRPLLDAFILDQLDWARERLEQTRWVRRPAMVAAAEQLFHDALMDPTQARP